MDYRWNFSIFHPPLKWTSIEKSQLNFWQLENDLGKKKVKKNEIFGQQFDFYVIVVFTWSLRWLAVDRGVLDFR